MVVYTHEEFMKMIEEKKKPKVEPVNSNIIGKKNKEVKKK